MFGLDDAIGAALNIGNTLVDRLIPDPAKAAEAKLALLKMQQDGSLAQLTAVTDLAKAQVSVNQAEASSGNAYAADWRPTIGYILGFTMAYVYVVAPFLAWFTALVGHPTPIPSLDFNSISPVLMGMLGLAGMSSYDKAKAN